MLRLSCLLFRKRSDFEVLIRRFDHSEHPSLVERVPRLVLDMLDIVLQSNHHKLTPSYRVFFGIRAFNLMDEVAHDVD